jgi:RNA polymerase sigma-B factor
MAVSPASLGAPTRSTRPSNVRESDARVADLTMRRRQGPIATAERDAVIAEYEWLIMLCARRMARRGESLDDLAQVARLGLLQAYERFNPDFGVTFRTFASATIHGVLRRHFRDSWRVHMPRQLQERHLVVSRAIEEMTGQLHRSPTTHELAQRLQLSDEEVLEALDAALNYHPLSLSSPYGDHADGETGSLEARVGAVDEALQRSAPRTDLFAALRQLPLRERTILYMRFFQERTQLEIATDLGVSQVHVSRLIRSALHQLRCVLSQSE